VTSGHHCYGGVPSCQNQGGDCGRPTITTASYMWSSRGTGENIWAILPFYLAGGKSSKFSTAFIFGGVLERFSYHTIRIPPSYLDQPEGEEIDRSNYINGVAREFFYVCMIGSDETEEFPVGGEGGYTKRRCGLLVARRQKGRAQAKPKRRSFLRHGTVVLLFMNVCVMGWIAGRLRAIPMLCYVLSVPCS